MGVCTRDPADFCNYIIVVFSFSWNAKCQLLWNDEIHNVKIFIGVFSSI